MKCSNSIWEYIILKVIHKFALGNYCILYVYIYITYYGYIMEIIWGLELIVS